jgi:4-hydroxythreonine-4-phosphate dehydrogenase
MKNWKTGSEKSEKKPLSRSKSDPKPRLGVTPGDPAGIGPDITLAAFGQAKELAELVVFADLDLMAGRADRLGMDIAFNDLSMAPFNDEALNIQPVPLRTPVVVGKPDSANAGYVLMTLSSALKACQHGNTSAIVTGPVSKSTIAEAGIPFTGHTEWFAEQTGTSRVVMMLTAGDLRVALATTHLPLADVPRAITVEGLTETLRILHDDLMTHFRISDPVISVCGLNPHAGEDGHLGLEEIDVIRPVIESLKKAGMKLTGPLPADTAFTDRSLNGVDAVLAMYHDQGLPVLKHAGFGNAVNITLGLPVLRTSVDHGTAFDLAGTGLAEPDSMLAAITSAAEIAGAATIDNAAGAG